MKKKQLREQSDKHHLFTDLDGTLPGDEGAALRFGRYIREMDEPVVFGIATGRGYEEALAPFRSGDLPAPEYIVCAVGTEIHIRRGKNYEKFYDYSESIGKDFPSSEIIRTLEGRPGLSRQNHFSGVKLSYFIDDYSPAEERAIRESLSPYRCNIIFSGGIYLDVLPPKASKYHAIEYLAEAMGISRDRIITAGDSGNDRDMITGFSRSIVVGNADNDLNDAVCGYRSRACYADGLLEGLKYFIE